jgi:hypothetical protein
MILGLSTSAFTLVDVILSLIGIAAAFVVAIGMFGSTKLEGWTALFLATTVPTSVTGFFFFRDHVLPSHIVGALSLIVLAIAILAPYRLRLEGPWRSIYVVSALVALYFNTVVAVVQAFQKVSFLNRLAPTQSDSPFIVAQFVVLAALIAIAIAGLKSFHPMAQMQAL